MADNQYFKDLGFRVTEDYGWRMCDGKKEFHPGVDLVTSPSHAPIKAFTSGTVVFAGDASKRGTGYFGFGNAVGIKDKYDCVHVYGHLSEVSVKVGDKVKVHDVIGKQGSEGKSSGEHLHYEIRKEPVYVADKQKRCYVPEEYLLQFDAVEAKKTKEVHEGKPKGTFYKIKAGDTISVIAKHYNTTGDAIVKLNPDIKNINKIRAGKIIRVV
jgi:murein DD-endopeptidase MepM/ murein hydrolase activator NlpD